MRTLYCVAIAWSSLGTLLWAQGPPVTHMYVDVNDPGTNPTGQQSAPYHSISYVINQILPAPSEGATLHIAGGTYRDRGLTGVDGEEDFPIRLEYGVTLQYWDRYGMLPSQLPPPVVLQGNGAPASTCFITNEPGGQRSFAGYLQTDFDPGPLGSRGIEIREFDIGLYVDQTRPAVFGGMNQTVALDGLRFRECGTSISTEVLHDTATLNITRSSFRGATGLYPGFLAVSKPQIYGHVFATGEPSATHAINIDSSDFEPEGASYPSSMVVFYVEGGGALGDLTVDGVTISDSSAYGTRVDRVGVEVLWRTGSDGTLTVNGSWITGCNEGLLCEEKGLSGSRPSVFLTESFFLGNGHNASIIDPALNAIIGVGNGFTAQVSQSGAHIAARDQGHLDTVKILQCDVSNNFRHGAFLEADHADLDYGSAIDSVEMAWSRFEDNGQGAVWGNGSLFSSVWGQYGHVLVRNCVFKGNRSSGIFGLLDAHAYTTKRHEFEIRNSVITENQGFGESGGLQGDYTGSPVAFKVTGQTDARIKMYLLHQVSQCTIAANTADWGYAVWDTSTSGQEHPDNLWYQGSSVDNTIVYDNTGVANGGAFYPPLPSILGTKMYGTTSYCNLEQGLVVYPPQNGNFFTNPVLGPHPLVGQVIPGAGSPVIDAGGIPAIGPDPKDILAKPRLVDDPGVPNNAPTVYDVGAVERQG